MAQKTGKLTNVQQITHDTERYTNVQWSPDGTKLAFSKEGYRSLIVLDVATQTRKTVTQADDAGMFYEWSADGNEILYRETQINNGPRLQRLCVADMQGNIQYVTVPKLAMQAGAWRYTANGKKQVVSQDAKIVKQPIVKQLPVAKRKKGVVAATKKATYTPYNDPDEQMFYLVDNETGEKRLLNDNFGLEPEISPDGTKVVFNNVDDLIVVDVDGKNRKNLGRGFRATWINNNQLVFQIATDDGHTYTGSELYMINIDGTNRVQLTHTPDVFEMFASWNGETNQLAFISFVDGQVYTAELY